MRANYRGFCGGIVLAEQLYLTIGPSGIFARKKKLVEKPKGEDIEKSERANAFVLALHPPLHLVALLFKNDDADEVGEGSHPIRQTAEIEGRIVVAD
jgi:hypothetical protein